MALLSSAITLHSRKKALVSIQFEYQLRMRTLESNDNGLTYPIFHEDVVWLIICEGAGGVGRHFLTQCSRLLPKFPNAALVLISRSNRSLRVPTFSHALSLSTWEKDLAASNDPAISPSEAVDYLSSAPGKCILVDNTSNQDIAASYPDFLKKGISVVTPNKKAFSSDLKLWQSIFESAYPSHPQGGLVYHESSVGAGLPIISTLKDLVETGDEVQKVEGVFSGTMSFLFNNFAPVEGKGGKWSDEVKKAKDAGYTEPDPRDDLNGADVARKLVILARIVGLQIESTSAFPVQSLIPKELESCGSGDEFMEKLPAHDDEMAKVKSEAETKGKVVRFVGSIDVASKKVQVGLRDFDKGHPIAGLKGSDNIISFYTKRYGQNPLIVQGAGAGGEVTAMGVTADLIKVIQRIS